MIKIDDIQEEDKSSVSSAQNSPVYKQYKRKQSPVRHLDRRFMTDNDPSSLFDHQNSSPFTFRNDKFKDNQFKKMNRKLVVIGETFSKAVDLDDDNSPI